jgi:hypothetical protein
MNKMKINPPNLLLAATTTLLVSSFSTPIPVQALTWTINNGSLAGTNPITGSFTIDNENSATPSLTFSNIIIGLLNFTKADLVNISLANPTGSGIEAIDWVNGSNSLSLVFNSPFLTTAEGTVTLNDVVSDFNGDIVTGSVTGVSNPPTTVPEPNLSLGLIAFGTLLVVRSRFN